MKNILSFDDLKALVVSNPPREQFGPESDRPYLAVRLDGSDTSLNNWLETRPCPVIGTGHGPAAKACDVVLENTSALSRIAENIQKAPLAAMTLVQHLRIIENMPVLQALTTESLAYATVQQGPEFKAWLKSYSGGPLISEDGPPLITDIQENGLYIRLNRPRNYNAIGVEVRDALCEILDMALAHGGFEEIHITGRGKTFSVGGAVSEFGQISDPATAHWVRSLRLPATRLAQIGDKLHIYVNGAAIGAGVELAAFAHHISCADKAWFQLPELKYGLLPGAGGTVSLSRRIGRHRTAYMALSMDKISARQALEWGLVDEIK